MPTNKDFKRLVRGRMQKTGESYTTARSHLLRTRPIRTPATQLTAPAPFPAPSEYAKVAGMSDAAVKQATGCPWERWVKVLDRVEAHTWPHREIADYVHEKYKTPDWWTQMVTVGYERIKGLRGRGQRRDGSYEASRSRVFAVPLGRLYRAFHDARARSRWLPGVKVTVRTATRDKSMRVTWPDGTSVDIGFYGKGAAKSQVAIQHSKLVDKADAVRRKEYWSARLSALGAILVPPKRTA